MVTLTMVTLFKLPLLILLLAIPTTAAPYKRAPCLVLIIPDVPSTDTVTAVSAVPASETPIGNPTSAVALPAATTGAATAPKITGDATTPEASAANTPAIGNPPGNTPAQPTPPSQGGMWLPTTGTTWQIILYGELQLNTDGTITPDVDVYELGLFATPQSTISQLHAKGKRVICHFSAGSYESYQPDAAKFDTADLGAMMDGWPEYYIDVTSPRVREIMAERIALAKEKGCDAINPDNVDGFENDNGLGLTRAQSEDFVKFLAQTAADLGMSTGLKNAADLVPSVLGSVHFAVNEQCAEYDECDVFAAFTKVGKPVFEIEYTWSGLSTQEMCDAAVRFQFSTVIKNEDLDGSVEYCDGRQFTTPTA